MLDAMIELLTLPEIQRFVAILAAVASGCISFRIAIQSAMAFAVKRSPHDGQAGLGAEFIGTLAFVLVACAMYLLVGRSLRYWEKRYTQKLDERDRLEAIRGTHS
jgi:hypothetical protein